MVHLSIKGACCDGGVLTDPNSGLNFLGFLPSMDDISGHLLVLTTYLSHRFIHFIKDLVCLDVLGCVEELIDFVEHTRYMGSSICGPLFETCLSSSTSVDSHVNTRYELPDTQCGYESVSVIFQGLTLPLRVTVRLTLATWRLYLNCMSRVRASCFCFVLRLQKTLRGSSDEIGWLQRTPGMASVVDCSERFLELLKAIKNGEHKLPDSFVYLLIPGLFSNHGPLYFVDTKRFFSKMGLACHIAKIHSEASVEHNAWALKLYIEELFWGSGKRVTLLGHSKGGIDAAAALSLYWDDLQDKVAGLALVQSPYGGTPIASDILREGQIGDKETRRIMQLLVCKLIKGDMRALEDLTYEKRREFIMKNKLPEQIPLISFHSEARIAPGVLASMTHIAHAELPWLPLLTLGRQEPDNVLQRVRQFPVIIPISAAMAICALHLQLRYGEKSDGLVTCRDAEVPGSVVVKPKMKLDHSFMVYPSSSSSSGKDLNEASAPEMCEALLTMLVEIGKAKKGVKGKEGKS